MRAYAEAENTSRRFLQIKRFFNFGDGKCLGLYCRFILASKALSFLAVFASPILNMDSQNLFQELRYAAQLFSFCRPSFHMSSSESQDVGLTVVLNHIGGKSFVYHWSDYMKSCNTHTQFSVHDYIFLWGPIMTRS